MRLKYESTIMSKISIYISQFQYYKGLAEKAIDQIGEDQVFYQADAQSNSIAVIIKHIAGNMRSRWTNMFETDGEKVWRNRDDEFVDDFKNLGQLLEYWESGWEVLFDTLEDLTDADLDSIIYIRNMGCTVHDAIIRQMGHYPYHIGQIVYLARMYRGEDFVSLSIPKGKSKEYNDKRFVKKKSIKHFTDDLE